MVSEPAQSLIHKDNVPERNNVDLYYTKVISTVYVYDKLDPTGTRLHSLFSGRAYYTGYLNSRSCVIVGFTGGLAIFNNNT